MPALIVYADGREETVDRCFLYETRDENGEWTPRWLIQRRPRRHPRVLRLPEEALKGAYRLDQELT